MKMYVVQGVAGQYLKRGSSNGIKTQDWVDNVWDATLFSKKNHASQTSPMQFNADGARKVVEVEVRVSLPKQK
jgi:hypothetical protein